MEEEKKTLKHHLSPTLLLQEVVFSAPFCLFNE